MLIFDQTAQQQLHQEGRWRTYQPGVRVRIRPSSTGDTRRFRKEAQKNGRFDETQFDELFWDHLIADWDGIVGLDKKKLPASAANKVAIVRALVALGNWIISESDKLAEEEAMACEEQLGNSGDSPAGKRIGPAKETSPLPAPLAG